ncbi:hypothetical protein Fcan01_00642 [Folsomia candida]|uniref:Uncharacterized protein n=1 Tax=Folsomia candida TaxID=158441 RepID=A0A226F1P2_FOLCA|nr:hypothetical protein Fcan01_00642 [Folsomia candida]
MAHITETSFIHILDTVKNCEVQIYHDGISSDLFPKSSYSPTTVMYKILRRSQRYSRDYRIREFNCKLTLLLSTYLIPISTPRSTEDETPYFFRWKEIAHFYYSDFKYPFLDEIRNGIPIFLLCYEGLGNEFEKAPCTEGDDTNVVDMFNQLLLPRCMWKVVFIDQAAKPFYEDLIKEIFLRTNKTDCEDYQSYHPDIYFSLMYLFAEVNLLSTNEQLPTLVTTNFQGYQFLTCYSKRYLTFAHFIKPFQVEVWVILFIFLVVLILGITLYIRFGGLGSTPFSPWLFILATMCEEGVLVPAELEKKAFFRYTFGAWILVSVVLVNCYNGIMVTDLNAPLPGETPSVFKDLLCPGELMSERDYKMRTQHKNKKATERFYEAWGLRIVGNDFWRREDCFHLLSYPLDPSGYQGLKTYPFFEFLYDTTFWYWISHFNEDRITEQILVLFTFLKSKQSFEPSAVTEEETKPRWPEYHLIPHLNASIEKEVVACGKAVLIREVADMQAELQFLKKYYHWIEFHKGNEILSPQPYGSHFVRAGNSKIPRLAETSSKREKGN